MNKHHALLFTNENKDSIIASSLVITAPRNTWHNYIENTIICDNQNIDMVIQQKIEKIRNRTEPMPEYIAVVGLTLSKETVMMLNKFRDETLCMLIWFNTEFTDCVCDWIVANICRSVTKIVHDYYSEISWSSDYKNKFNPIANIVENNSEETIKEVCYKPYETIKRLVQSYEGKNDIVFRWPD